MMSVRLSVCNLITIPEPVGQSLFKKSIYQILNKPCNTTPTVSHTVKKTLLTAINWILHSYHQPLIKQ